jgi:hypothetical protein
VRAGASSEVDFVMEPAGDAPGPGTAR